MPETKFLTEQEVEILVLALAGGREGKTFTQEEAKKVIRWAEDIRIDMGILGSILNGDVLITEIPDDGPTVTLSQKGKLRAVKQE